MEPRIPRSTLVHGLRAIEIRNSISQSNSCVEF